MPVLLLPLMFHLQIGVRYCICNLKNCWYFTMYSKQKKCWKSRN